MGRKPERFHASGAKHGPKTVPELRVAVMQHIWLALKSASFGVAQVAGSVLNPLLCWVSGEAGQRYVSCLQMDHKQDIVRRRTAPGEHFGSKEIPACQNRHVRRDEILPCGSLTPLRSGRDPMTAQYITDGLVGDVVAEICQPTVDPVVPPSRSSHAPPSRSTVRSQGQSSAAPGRSGASNHRTSAPPVSATSRESSPAGPLAGLLPDLFGRAVLPIPPRVARSALESLIRTGACARRLRFSAARSSTCSSSS